LSINSKIQVQNTLHKKHINRKIDELVWNNVNKETLMRIKKFLTKSVQFNYLLYLKKSYKNYNKMKTLNPFTFSKWDKFIFFAKMCTKPVRLYVYIL
jgi:hypothetical protein